MVLALPQSVVAPWTYNHRTIYEAIPPEDGGAVFAGAESTIRQMDTLPFLSDSVVRFVRARVLADDYGGALEAAHLSRGVGERPALERLLTSGADLLDPRGMPAGDAKAIQGVLAQAQVTTTLRVYTHAYEASRIRVTAAAAELIRPRPNSRPSRWSVPADPTRGRITGRVGEGRGTRPGSGPAGTASRWGGSWGSMMPR